MIGFGAALPARVLTSVELGEPLGLTEDWIVERTGVRSRRVLGATESLGELVAEASTRALAAAGRTADEVDHFVVATTTPDDFMPAQAMSAGELAGINPGALVGDFVAACNGFAGAVVQAAAMIEAGRARLAVVCGAEALSRAIDYDDPKTAPLFGDGAGAVVLAPVTATAGIGPAVTGFEYRREALYADRPTSLIRMRGREVFVNAVQRMSDSTIAALELAGRRVDDVGLLVLHQANARIVTAVCERIGLDESRAVVNIEDVGNTSAASIPLALAAEFEAGRLADDGLMVIAAFGGGFAWTAFTVAYEGVSP